MSLQKRYLSLLVTLPFISIADEAKEYTGPVTNLFIGKSEQIKIGVLEDENEPVECYASENASWQFHFEANQHYSDRWFEILNLVRRTQEPIRIGYQANDESSCAIEYLALFSGNGNNNDNVDVPTDGLERNGSYGNIALLGSNGLSESSYSASDYYNNDEAHSAFDGYTFDSEVADGVGSPTNRNIWLVKKDTSKSNDTQYWLQVEFNEPVKVSGFRVILNSKSVSLGRGPKEIIAQASIDGSNFVDHQSVRFNKAPDQRANFSSKIELTHFRVLVKSNWGDAFIEIDELEVFAN